MMRILVLTDRDWTHPDAGGTGTTLRALARRWIDGGHRVTIVASTYEGAPAYSRPHERLEIHRMGDRLTVFPRAALACWRGLGRDADVVFEIVNGIAFFTPLWRFLRAPGVVFVQHVHQEHYILELGSLGRIGRLLLERLPLKYLYRHRCICTISQSARKDLIKLGVPAAAIRVVHLGVEPIGSNERRARVPTLLYLGRLKRYKRLEILLDILETIPGAVLEVAGEGDYRERFEAEVQRRGLSERVVVHGFVPQEAKADLYRRSWLLLTTSAAEGWGLTVMEAAICGTPSAALRVGGLREAIVDGETGLLADDPTELTTRVGEAVSTPDLLAKLGSAAARRARSFSWEESADQMMRLLRRAAAGQLPAPANGRAVRGGHELSVGARPNIAE